MDGNGNSVIIGNNVVVNAMKKSKTCFNACGGQSITIEDNCLFSNGIEIHTTDYHHILYHGVITNHPKSIVIRKHCWIGLKTVILKGVDLAEGTIIGANTIVTKGVVEKNCVVVGNPAVIIKRNINWES